MRTTLAATMVKFGRTLKLDKLPIPFRCVPTARVAILEGRVKVDGKTRMPDTFTNPHAHCRQHYTDIDVPKGKHHFEVWCERGLCYEWTEEIE